MDEIDNAAKNMMPFAWDMMKKLENCKHELVSNTFPLDPRLKHIQCYCQKIQYIEMTKDCHKEIMMDPDLRNITQHKVKDGQLVELFGLEVKIV